MPQQKPSSSDGKIDFVDQKLLKDWDIARFFPKSNNIAEKDSQQKAKEHVSSVPRRLQQNKPNSSETLSGHSKFIPNVFRRENTDFFVPSARHSAVFLEGRRSDIQQRRSSDASKNSVEPIDSLKKPWKPTRPRRERTDGDIILPSSRQRLTQRPLIENKRLESTGIPRFPSYPRGSADSSKNSNGQDNGFSKETNQVRDREVKVYISCNVF